MANTADTLWSCPNLPEFDPAEFVIEPFQLQFTRQDYAVRPVRWYTWQNAMSSLGEILATSATEQQEVASLCSAEVVDYKYGFVYPGVPKHRLPDTRPGSMSFTHPELPDGAILAARVAIQRNVREPNRLDVIRISRGLSIYAQEKTASDNAVVLEDMGERQFARIRTAGSPLRKLKLLDIEPTARLVP